MSYILISFNACQVSCEAWFCYLGCYSDGDGDTSHDILYTRRNRGKRYAALSKEDSLDHGEVLELHDSDEIGLHVHDSLCARILPESAVGNHRHSYVSQHGCEGVISHNNASDDGSFLYVHQDYSEGIYLCHVTSP